MARLNPWKGLASLPRSVWVVFAATLINRAGTMVMPFLVLYLTRSMGMPAARAGLALTVYGLGALITGPLSGRLSDKVGALRVAEVSLLVSGVVVLLLPFLRSFEAILAVTFLWALTGESFRPAVMTVVTDLVAAPQRKPAFALIRLAINLGMSLGPAVGGLLAMHSFTGLFVVDGLTSIAAGVVLLAARRRRAANRQQVPAQAGSAGSILSSVGDARLIYFLAAFLPVLMVFFQSQGAMPLHMVHHLGMSEAAYGLMFSLNTVMIILIEVPLTAATSHWPNRLSLPLGAALTGAGFGAMAFVHGYAGVAMTVVIWTFGEMILLPTATAYVAEIAPDSKRGQYMGFYSMTFSLAFTMGPWLGAAVLAGRGPGVLWTGAFVLAMISALLLGRIGQARPGSGGGAARREGGQPGLESVSGPVSAGGPV